MTSTPESQQAALKPCPCCGQMPERIYGAGEDKWIECKGCGMQTAIFRTDDAAAKKWNLRTPAPVDHAALAEKLAYYKQADDDGVMCLVSRQAVDEAIAALRAHPAGGVSEEQLAEWLCELAAAEDKDQRMSYADLDITTQELWRIDARFLLRKLRAAGIGAGVVSQHSYIVVQDDCSLEATDVKFTNAPNQAHDKGQ